MLTSVRPMTPSPPDRSTDDSVRRGGDREALDRLVPEVYAELRRIAHRELARDRAGHTLDSAALVHEAYLKLARQGDVRWVNRSHFCAIAARAMRTVLIDYARTRGALKRSGGESIPTDPALPGFVRDDDVEHLLALDEALTRLAAVDGEACQVVEWRYFAGLTLEEYAQAHHVSLSTARRRWSFAKAWLRRQLAEAS